MEHAVSYCWNLAVCGSSQKSISRVRLTVEFRDYSEDGRLLEATQVDRLITLIKKGPHKVLWKHRK